MSNYNNSGFLHDIGKSDVQFGRTGVVDERNPGIVDGRNPAPNPGIIGGGDIPGMGTVNEIENSVGTIEDQISALVELYQFRTNRVGQIENDLSALQSADNMLSQLLGRLNNANSALAPLLDASIPDIANEAAGIRQAITQLLGTINSLRGDINDVIGGLENEYNSLTGGAVRSPGPGRSPQRR